MTNQPDRERIHAALDRALSGMTGDPLLWQRVERYAAAREKGERRLPLKGKWALTMALIALLTLTIATAGDTLVGNVYWDGTLARPTQSSSAEATPPPSYASPANERETLRQAFIDAHPAQDGEYVQYFDGERRLSTSFIKRTAESLDELEQLIGGSMLLPIHLPEGYTFSSGFVQYGTRPEAVCQQTNVIEDESGLRTVTCIFAPEDEIPISYHLELKSKDARISVAVILYHTFDINEAAMYLPDVLETYTASVPGMTRAVAMRGVEQNHVIMYGDLPESITFRFMAEEKPETHSQFEVLLHGSVSPETLLAMFGGQ